MAPTAQTPGAPDSTDGQAQRDARDAAAAVVRALGLDRVIPFYVQAVVAGTIPHCIAYDSYCQACGAAWLLISVVPDPSTATVTWYEPSGLDWTTTFSGCATAGGRWSTRQVT